MMAGFEFDIWRPLAGLMIFLLAMRLIESAIKAIAGARIKQTIAANTSQPLRGVLTGTIATALLQSSSLVGLLVLAFVGARLMALRQALLIVFGANLGTTATGWLVALLGFKLDLDAISLPMIALGGLLYSLANYPKVRNYGELGLGLGLLLLALQFMKSALGEMGDQIEPGLLEGFALWQYALFGIVASALMQSSSAVMVLTLSAIYSGVIDLPAGAALMIGADLGTTSTVMFGAIGGGATKKRVALGHVIFNLVTDLFAFVFIYPLLAIAALLEDPLMALVAFHSLFNLAGVIIWTPLVSQLARALEQRFRVPTDQVNRFLDPGAAELPESALRALADEVGHLAQRIIEQNSGMFAPAVPTKDEFRASYMKTKRLEAEILQFALTLRLDEKDKDQETGGQVDRLLQSGRNLLLSSKLCKDNINDLRHLADYESPLFEQVITSQREFYAQLPSSWQAVGELEPGQIEGLIEQNRCSHDHLHDEIYEAIRNDDLPRKRVSTVLNLNRAIFNSNLSLLTGIALLAQHTQKNRMMLV